MTSYLIVGLWMLGSLTVGLISAILAKYYGKEALTVGFISLLLMSNIVAIKIVGFSRWNVPAAILIYSSTFLVTDLLTEFYGLKEAQKTVMFGFFANMVMIFSIWISLSWAAAPFWEGQEAMEQILGLVPRIVIASMIGYLISQNFEIYVFHFWKEKFKGKQLWLRNNLTSLITMFIDTIIFIPLAFYGTMPESVIRELIIGQYIVKILIASIDTGFIYAVHDLYKRLPEKFPIKLPFT